MKMQISIGSVTQIDIGTCIGQVKNVKSRKSFAMTMITL